jgi:haloalkane dehalogenase
MEDPRYWLNKAEYPFSLQSFETEHGTLKYIDEGSGHAVVFVHGNIAWSFLFRKIISDLSSDYRCISLDHLGFGLSEKPVSGTYSPQDHAARFKDFMEKLELTDVTLVVHDFGAAVALDWAAEHPTFVRNIVILNSYAWSLKDNEPAMKLSKLISNPLNRFYYRVIQSTPNFILPTVLGDRHTMTKRVANQYLRPFETHDDRKSVFSIIDSWKKTPEWFDGVASKLERLRSKPVLLLWGMKDPMFGELSLRRFQTLFPQNQAFEFDQSGRFLPEEQPEQVTEKIRLFLMTYVPVPLVE